MPIGIAITIANIYPFITYFFGIIFFKETLSIFSLFIIGLMFLGIYLIKENHRGETEIKYIYFPILTAIFWALYYLMTAYLIREFTYDVFAVSFYTEGIIFLIALFTTLHKNPKELSNFFNKKIEIRNGFLAGLFLTLGSLTIFKSFEILPLAIASSISNGSIMLTAIFGYLFFKEKLHLKQILGVVIVTVSIVLFYFVI